MGGEDRLQHLLLGELVGGGLHHHHRLAGAGDHQVEVGDVALAVGGIDDQLAVDHPDADGADRVVEGDLGQRQRRRGAVDGEDVGVVLAVGREHEGDDLRLVEVALGEERAQRTVDEAGGDDLLLGRAPLALEEAARDAAAGVGVLFVVDGERQEVLGQALAGHGGGGEHHGVAQAHGTAAVGLAGHAAGLDHQRALSELDLTCLDHGSLFSLFLSTTATRSRERARGTSALAWIDLRRPVRPALSARSRRRDWGLLADA